MTLQAIFQLSKPGPSCKDRELVGKFEGVHLVDSIVALEDSEAEKLLGSTAEYDSDLGVEQCICILTRRKRGVHRGLYCDGGKGTCHDTFCRP